MLNDSLHLECVVQHEGPNQRQYSDRLAWKSVSASLTRTASGLALYLS